MSRDFIVDFYSAKSLSLGEGFRERSNLRIISLILIYSLDSIRIDYL